MPNVNFDNINSDHLRKYFENFLSKEQELFNDSLGKQLKELAILVKMNNVFDELWGDITKGKFGAIGQYSLAVNKMKGIMQSLSFAPLFMMKGNIRAGFSEMRFAIEEVCLFVYLLNDKNYKNTLELMEDKKDSLGGGNDDKVIKGINEKLKEKAHEYLKEIEPKIDEELKESKRGINKFFMHGAPIGSQDRFRVTLSGDALTMEPFDSEGLRDESLKRSILHLITLMLDIYLIICTGLERRSSIPMSEYRKRAKLVEDLLEEHVKPPSQ